MPVSRNTSRAMRPGDTPSAMTIPNSRVRSSTDMSWVFSTLNATRITSTAYMKNALPISA